MTRFFRIVLLFACSLPLLAVAQKPSDQPRHAEKLGLFLDMTLDHTTDQNQTVHLFVQGQVNEIQKRVQALGGVFKYSFRDYAAIHIPAGKIRDLAGDPAVERIAYHMGRGEVLNDTMLINNNVIPAHNGDGDLPGAYEGSDVVIGIIDTGIELTHPDFQDSLGNTRIAYVWDQTWQPTDSAFDLARVPSPYAYGQEWDAADIDAGNSLHKDQFDLNGHGTNVTGAAASNGLAVGDYKGVAPQADIIAVAADFSGISDWTLTVADAVDYIFAKAAQMGKPAVINASLGTYLGSHDGLDPAAQMIDNLITSSPGRAMVCAAGNCGSGQFHLGYDVTSDTSFTWFKWNPNMNGGNGALYFACYADTADFNGVQFGFGADKVDSTGATVRGFTNFSNIQQTLGNIVAWPIVSFSGNNLGTMQTLGHLNGGVYHLEVLMTFCDSTDYYYRFMTKGAGRFDCWSQAQWGTSNMGLLSELPPLSQFPDSMDYRAPDTDKTIVDSWACSPHVITVGNYFNRKTYVNFQGDTVVAPSPSHIPGAMTPSSSSGPTRDNRLKPEISASGDWTLTAGMPNLIAVLAAGDSDQVSRVAPGLLHHRQSGTSMASPVVSGAVALYFEKCPYADNNDVRNALANTAKTDNFTGTVPNNDWGHGKLDTYELLRFTNFQASVQSGGDTVVCPGDSINLFVVGSYSGYSWSTGSPFIDAYATGAGDYYVDLVNLKGCAGTSDTITIMQAPPSQAPDIAVGGATEFCEGDSVTLSVPAGFATYQWPDGSTGTTMTVYHQGNFYVQVTDAEDCNVWSDTVSVQVHLNPEPAINLSGDTMIATAGFSSYQWYHSDTLIFGATTSVLTATESGNYFVAVTDDFGCDGISDPISMSIVGLGDATNPIGYSVYPNPTCGQFTLSWSGTPAADAQALLVNAVGQPVAVQRLSGLDSHTSHIFDLTGAAQGLYFLYIRSQSTNLVQKVVLH